MVTNLKLDLSEEDRKTIHLHVTGKPGLATRKMIQEFILKSYRTCLHPAEGKTVLKTTVCPKCNKPIAVNVPAPVIAPVAQPTLEVPEKSAAPVDVKKAAQAAALALTRLAEVL